MLSDLALLFDRDLEALEREVALFPDESSLWQAVPGQPNTAGTLVLHLCGNLRHFVGSILGGTGYVRNRDLEFSRRGVPREELVGEIRLTRNDVAATFRKLQGSDLAEPFPQLVGKDVQTTNQRFLMHLLAHLAYHLGQIDYARRGTTGDAAGANVMAVGVLGT